MAGDPSTIPDGHVRQLTNILVRPGPRWDSRPPAVYDGLMSIIGLARWEDLVNQQTRFIALDASKLYKKATSGESFDAGTSGLSVTRLTSYANYRGKLYMMFDDGAGNPNAAAVWDGTNLSTSPFDTALFSRLVVPYGDRLFFLHPRVTVTPSVYSGGTFVKSIYDLTFWTQSGCTATNITSGGATVCRVYITSATAGLIFTPGFGGSGIGDISFAASDKKRVAVWRSDMRGNDSLFSTPFTMEVFLNTQWTANTAYVVGDLISDGTNRQRCTTAGTSGGAAPAWAATVGATTADNTATWTMEGPRALGSLEDEVPSATVSDQFSTFSVVARIPDATNTLVVKRVIKWFNTTHPSVTLTSVDVSLRDGVADGDPTKRNFGQQITIGSYNFPFVNTETATSASVNLEDVIWSETSTVPPIIRAANTYAPQEAAGLAMAGRVVGKRLVMWKRRAFWVFNITDDPDNPIAAETVRTGVGCIGPLAEDVLDDESFFLSENECYRMRIGEDPKPFAGDAMREEIFARGSDWVESQSTYNMPILRIDHKNREVLVYTQRGKYYVFNLATDSWSVCDIQGKEIRSMLYNQATQKMEISLGGFGLVRLDDTSIVYDTIDNTAATHTVVREIICRPFELFHPRAELCLHEIGLYHLATQDVGDYASIYTSNDRGTTFPHYASALIQTSAPRIPLTLMQFGVSVMPKISVTGYPGKAAFSISKAEAMVELLAGEWPWAQPPQGSYSL